MEHTDARHAFAYVASLGALLWLTQCSHRAQFVRKKVTITRPEKPAIGSTLSKTPPPVTVWIHGTRFIRRPVFYQHFDGKPGLKKATSIDPHYHVRIAANSLHAAAPEIFPLETFYIFGWSGKLNAIEREQSAMALYHGLQHIRSSYKKAHGCWPAIQLITHSHGGNVALNLAQCKDTADQDFAIDSLILLACPVQARTMDMIKAPLFKRVYALYSSLDLVQIIAPQIVYRIINDDQGKRHVSLKIPPLSERMFPPTDNLVQVKIKLNNRAIMHAEFIEEPFLTILPSIVHHIDTWQKEHPSKLTRVLCVQTTPRRIPRTWSRA